MLLNTEQHKAALHQNGPMLVTAGPGSGKTAVITHRVKHLIDTYHIKPENILTVTFTKAAALQMETRFRKLMVPSSQRPVFNTFHSVFYKILRIASFSEIRIVSEKERFQIIKSEIARFDPDLAENNEFVFYLSGRISSRKNILCSDDVRDFIHPEPELISKVFSSYQSALKKNGRMDFDDIAIHTYQLLKSEPSVLEYWKEYFRYIQIDEFQDINLLQYEVLRLLTDSKRNLFAVGDADQSIYGFRGAAPTIMNRFLRDYPESQVINLDRNYRCPEIILAPCRKLIQCNPDRISSRITSRADNREAVFDIREYDNQHQEYTEIAGQILRYHQNSQIPFQDMAVLLRSFRDIAGICKLMKSLSVPCFQADTDLFHHFITRDIFAYFKAALGTASRKDLLRIINRPSRFISANSIPEWIGEDVFDIIRKYYSDNSTVKASVAQLESHLKFLKKLSPRAGIEYILKALGYEAYLKRENIPGNGSDIIHQLKNAASPARSIREFLELSDSSMQNSFLSKSPDSADENRIHILTMHASKGLEFRVVFIPDLNEHIIPTSHAKSKDAVYEERRLLYVAMTRSCEKLHLSSCRNMHGKPSAPSVFLDDIRKE